MGDNIFARPFVREAAKHHAIYLETPWPEIYEDLDIHFLHDSTHLRTQKINVDRQHSSRWSNPPARGAKIRVNYGAADFMGGGIGHAYFDRWRGYAEPDLSTMDLPDMGVPCPVPTDRPIAVVRPCTVRLEWSNPARNPYPDYIKWLAASLRRTHCVVVVADIDNANETLVGDAPEGDYNFLRGELDVRKLLTLCRHADVLVGGVGWIVPASIALKVKCFVVLGGHGGHNAPDKITHPQMDLNHIGYAEPDRFCRCTNMRHPCNKHISNLPEQWDRFAARVGLPLFAAG